MPTVKKTTPDPEPMTKPMSKKKPLFRQGTILNPFTESHNTRTPEGKKEVKTRRYKNLLGNPVERQTVKEKLSGPGGKSKRKEKTISRTYTNPITGRTTEKTVKKVKGYGRIVTKNKY